MPSHEEDQPLFHVPASTPKTAFPADRDGLHAERARGEVRLSMGPTGIRRLREGGSLKIRVPSGSRQGILINTAGGIAGGDAYSVSLEAEAHSHLSVTSQAAERVYRTLGPMARFDVNHHIEPGGVLHWLPQETILFDGSGLCRSVHVDMAADATFLGLETTILGRRESGETIGNVQFRENWSIVRNGELIHADRFRLDGSLPRRVASLRDAGAFATLILVSPDAEERLSRCHGTLATGGGVSAWNGKLVMRLVATDGFEIRKLLLKLLALLLPSAELPKAWLL